MLTQKEAVFNAITSFYQDNSIDFEPGQKAQLDASGKAAVTEIVMAGIESGEVAFNGSAEKYDTPEKVKSYVGSMIGNWLTKDKRLNGGEAYTPKNPGSRVGQGDAELKELKKLQKQVLLGGNEEHISAVATAIEERKQFLAQSKVKPVEINADLIPESLQGLLES